jgi:iron(III) transport system substrate-binding protein
MTGSKRFSDLDSSAIDALSSRHNRRKVLGAGLALAAAAGLMSTGRVMARQDDATPAATPVGGRLVIYSGRNENLVGPLIEQFQEETGISVEVRYAGTTELAATILEEGDNSPADVFFAQDAGALGALQAEGLLADLPEGALNRVDARFRSPEGQWVGASGRARVAVYNTDELSEEEMPASVEELTGSEWEGRVAWAPTNASFQSFITAFRELRGEDAARDWLSAMRDNGAVAFENNGAIVRAVGAGEIPVGLVNHYYLYEIQQEEGEMPIANHFFSGGDVGSLVNVAGVGILASAVNTEQAAAFVDFLLSPTAQEYFAQETSEYPLIEGIPTVEGLLPLDEIQSPDIDLSELADLQGTLDLLTEVGIV